MKIAIGADHRGFDYKNFIMQHQHREAIDWLDMGCFLPERCDYPEYARLVAEAILHKKAELGVLLCGSGIGMSIAANRFTGIYAGLCWNADVAKVAKEADNINILVIPSDFVNASVSIEIINTWLNATFKKGHYQKRLELLDNF